MPPIYVPLKKIPIEGLSMFHKRQDTQDLDIYVEGTSLLQWIENNWATYYLQQEDVTFSIFFLSKKDGDILGGCVAPLFFTEDHGFCMADEHTLKTILLEFDKALCKKNRAVYLKVYLEVKPKTL